jgi:hypothetical protein
MFYHFIWITKATFITPLPLSFNQIIFGGENFFVDELRSDLLAPCPRRVQLPGLLGVARRLGFRLGFAVATGSHGSPELHGRCPDAIPGLLDPYDPCERIDLAPCCPPTSRRMGEDWRDPRLADTWWRRSTLSPCRCTSPRSWTECRRTPPCRAAGQFILSSRHAASSRLELHQLVAFLIALCAWVNTSTSYSLYL